jgi:hypothetical protein
MDETQDPLREIAASIQRYRQEWADRVRGEIEADVAKMEREGFDPGKGRGRGPWWANA